MGLSNLVLENVAFAIHFDQNLERFHVFLNRVWFPNQF